MKMIFSIATKTTILELALFTIIASVAMAAGYASVSAKNSHNDITGTTLPIKVAPMTTMQAMPDPITNTAD